MHNLAAPVDAPIPSFCHVVRHRRRAAEQARLWASTQAPPAGKLRRSAMFIADNVKKSGPKPRRGGTLLDDASCAAPPGLRKAIEGRGCYKHVAPPELDEAVAIIVPILGAITPVTRLMPFINPGFV